MLERTPQAFVNACFSILWNSGYSTLIDDDLRSCVDFLIKENPGGIVNDAANPDFHRLEPDNSFWIAIRERTGDRNIVACICQRMLETEDFLEEQSSLRLWYGDNLDGRTPFELAKPKEDYPEIKGLVGHPAGLFVAPTERRNGLAWLLQRLVRALSIIRWSDMGWQCGTTRGPLVERGIPTNTYGYPNCDLLVDGWFEPSGLTEQAFMTSIDREEMLLQIADDLLLIEMNADKQVGDIVRTARQRHGHAPVLPAMAA